jgi:hypothetical protein
MGKDFKFNPHKIEIKDNEIIFISDKGVKLHLQPFFELKQFEKYFIESIKKSNKIDYFLMNKFTKKYFTTSEIEPRIVCFDWTQQLIRYYGPDNRGIKVYNVIVPNPIPGKNKLNDSKYTYMINKESYDRLLKEHSSNIEFTKFLFEIFYPNEINPLQNTSNPTESNIELDQYLTKMGFLNSNQSATDLFDSINSTELKEDWKEYLISKLTLAPLPFMHDNYEEHNISLDGYIQHELSRNNSYYKLSNKIHETPLTHIFVKINGDLHRINITKDDMIGESKKCGADNCFKTITLDDGKTYGVRFSKKILFDKSIILYDTIIEMLINCISYFTLQKLKEGQRIPIADIQPLSDIGFYKVNIKIKDRTIYGYIPYTVYEMNEKTITLYDLLKNILNGKPSEYTVDKIKEILGTVCLQIYNFYNIMYPSIKFEHNDFKIDNIVLNPETLQVYIIDFGLSRINVILKDRNYQIFKREVKELERRDDTSNFYFYISDIYQKYYLNKQADIEKLTVWLKDITLMSHFPNQENYKTVIQSSLIPHIKFLEYLSLKDIETSDKISYYKERESKDQLGFSACQDLFLYTMDEFKQAIDSLLNKDLSRNDSQSNCMSVINSKLPSKSPSPSPSPSSSPLSSKSSSTSSTSPSSSQLSSKSSSTSSTSSKSLNRTELARVALKKARLAEAIADSIVGHSTAGGARKTRKVVRKNKNKTRKVGHKNKTRKHKKN